MSNFNKLVDKLLTELANVAGGVGAVTGPTTSGNYGNQFPSQDDKAYNYGDARIAVPLGSKKNPYIKQIQGKKLGNKKPIKTPIQRRSVYLPGM